MLRFLPWPGLGFYFGLYTAGIFFIFCFLLGCFNFLLIYYRLFYVFTLIFLVGLAYLVVFLLSVVELRVFLIVVAIYHSTFIFLSILPCSSLGFGFFYILGYIFLS